MMKRPLLAIVCFLNLAVSAFAQGTITWNNRMPPTVDWRVADWNGNFLSGPGYTAQLWVGPSGTGSLQATSISSTFRTGAAAGYFNSLGDVQVDGFAPGATVIIQVRVWNNAGGTINSFNEASDRSQSGIISVTLGGAGSPPSLAANLSGFGTGGVTAWALVPEPPAYVLGALGIGAFLVLHRRRLG